MPLVGLKKGFCTVSYLGGALALHPGIVQEVSDPASDGRVLQGAVLVAVQLHELEERPGDDEVLLSPDDDPTALAFSEIIQIVKRQDKEGFFPINLPRRVLHAETSKEFGIDEEVENA